MIAATRGSRLWAVGVLAGVLLAGAYLAAGQPLTASEVDPSADRQSAVDRELTVNVTAVDCPAGYDNQADDDVCLAYDGQIPGPTFVFEQGERVRLTLNHRVPATISNTSASSELAEELSSLRYTLHRHGVSVEACDDGVARPRGTQVCDSSVGPPSAERAPNGTVVYNFTARFPGYWHYHDHSLGLSVGTVHGDEAGPQAEHRGLWGAFRVLEAGESTDRVFDLHLLDTGPNGGLGLEGTVQAGDRFDFQATGLGDYPWTVSLEDPDGETLWTTDIGPGVVRGHTVQQAQPGTYEWTAQSPLLPGETFTGQIEVVQG